jgi:polar amino acid transport system substrate-binding protein
MTRFRARLRAVVAAMALCCGAAQVQAAQETVTLCFERQDVKPWRTQQGGGLNFELLNLVAQRLGIHFDFQSAPWKRCLQQLQANAYDGAFAVSYKADRRELGVYPGVNSAGGAAIDNSKRMHVDSYVLLRRRGSKVDWDGKTLRNLEGPVGFQLGYSVGEVLQKLKVETDEGSQRADELARKLIAGRLGAAALGGSDARSVMHSALGVQLEMLPVPLIEKPYFLILSHGMVAKRPELAQRIWAAMEQVRNSAAYKKIERAALDEAEH